MYKVLIVDDSRTARLFIKRCAEMLGTESDEFFEAAHGEDALKLLEEHEIDLVISDCNMPLMDGKALLQAMKADELLEEIPIIFITSLQNEAFNTELQELGAHRVLKKPLQLGAFAEALEELWNL